MTRPTLGDAELVARIREAVVRRIDAGEVPDAWNRMRKLDPALREFVSSCLMAELQAHHRTGVTIRALHLRGLGIEVDDAIPDHARVREFEDRGCPVIRVHFEPWGN